MNKLMLVLQLVKKTIGNFSWPEFVGKKRPGNQNLYKKTDSIFSGLRVE